MSGYNDDIIVGIDLGEEMTYISFGVVQGNMVTTVASSQEERYGIPTVMCYDRDKDKWAFGGQAAQIAAENKDVLYSSLLNDAVRDSVNHVPGQETAPDSIRRLKVFIAHCMELAAAAAGKKSVYEPIIALSIAVRYLDENVLKTLDWAISSIRGEIKLVRFMTYSECFFYYTMNQPPEIWRKSVLLLDYNKDVFKKSILRVNARSTPSIVRIEEGDITEMPPFDEANLEESDRTLTELLQGKIDSPLANEVFNSSSVYLSGLNFEGDWGKDFIKFLCNGRRVFQGQNLYTKGACYGAREMLVGGYVSQKFFFLGQDKLRCNIGIRMMSGGLEVIKDIVDAGINWYDLHYEEDVMLGKDKDICLVLNSITGGDERNCIIRLDDIPDRQVRSCRLHLVFSMKSPGVLNVRIIDRGLGELIPASGTVIQEEINIYESER
ncbi:MAG: hypothetical protein K6F99_06735 [Lachnospiraceae bacterium]|nr:hypothetical protein [Lachnospiraceae bacterium]